MKQVIENKTMGVFFLLQKTMVSLHTEYQCYNWCSPVSPEGCHGVRENVMTGR